MDPLPIDLHPELDATFAVFRRSLGFVPNSVLTMQRRPEVVRALGELARVTLGPGGTVDAGIKRLAAHVASRAAGCRYCQAHSLLAAERYGVPRDKLDAVWDYVSSPLFSEAERAVLEFAFAAGSVPNAVDEACMDRLRGHWDDDAIVEILAAICTYAYLSRWNDSLATPLEAHVLEVAGDLLLSGDWDAGKHVP